MSWPEADLFQMLTSRTEPGQGAAAVDSGIDGQVHLKMRSIPNVDTPRLIRVQAYLHWLLHTEDGMTTWDDSKRKLVNTGIRLRCVNHELKLRGYGPPPCQTCQGHHRKDAAS